MGERETINEQSLEMIIKDAYNLSPKLLLYYDTDNLLNLELIDEINTETYAIMEIQEIHGAGETLYSDPTPTNYGKLRYRDRETMEWIRDIGKWITDHA